MERHQAAKMMREELNAYGLTDWGVRLNQNADSKFLGLCSYKDKCIILSAHHIDIHPEPDVIDTIKHELAHALVGPGHGHDEVWAAKARAVGCTNTLPCSTLSLNPEVIDAIRSGASVEVTFEEQVIRTPKYTITRLQDKCDKCGKVAKSVDERIIRTPDDNPYDMKFITLECNHMMMKRIPKGTPFHTFQMGGNPLCKHEWDKNKCVLCGRNRPYAFQTEGMKFAETALAVNNGVLIADEMGLGKTIQAGGIVYYGAAMCSPTLWIVKSGLKYQFSSFIINWMNEDPSNVNIPQIVNTSKDWLIPGLKHYIIGYDMLVQKTRTLKSGKTSTSGFDIAQFDRVGIKCVVLDECQQIKNADSSRTQMVRKVVKDRKVIGLSGTPWNNRGSELFPILNMIAPTKFYSAEAFKREWVSLYWHGATLKEGGIKNIELFKEYTEDIVIRRERKAVMAELPLVNRTKLNVVMDETQEAIYDEAVENFVQWYESQKEEMTGMAIIAMMAKLRHLVALAKIPATIDYVNEFAEDTDRKLVVFAHHVDVQAILYDEIHSAHGDEILVLKFTADMNSVQRNEAVDKFNSAKRAIFIMSQGAGGEGLNLQTCSDCLMHERQWNPGREEQCEGRFIRIGQTSDSVNAVYTHMEGLTAIDQQLDAIVERKRIQFHNWTGSEAEKWSEDAIVKELAASIVNAHNAKKNRTIAARG
jgi:SWI/SNF-related matrix-associated actin-dependent regulator of chromatin subfamily A-like protein 1